MYIEVCEMTIEVCIEVYRWERREAVNASVLVLEVLASTLFDQL